MKTLDEMLMELENPNKPSLENTKTTWKRIGAKDEFSELGLEVSELDSFLQEWMDENPYEAI
jgi:hypothetical protein